MSTVITKNLQIGADGTASNNFTWYQPSTPDGSVRLGSGNSGSVTDLMTLTSTGLGIGTSSPAAKLDVNGTGLVGSFGSNTVAETYVQVKNGTSTLYLGGSSSYNYVYGTASVPLTFWTNSAERMRLDSSGNLGIGTSSPNQAGLDKAVSVNGTSHSIVEANVAGGRAGYMYAASQGTVIGEYRAKTLQFTTSDTVRATLDSSGNLGLGVTPSAWHPNTKAFDVNIKGALYGGGAGFGVDVALWGNAYYSGTAPTYKTSAAASIYSQSSGAHSWYTAPSGTAGSTISFTQAMTLDASGNLLVGSTSGSVRLDVVQSNPTRGILQRVYNSSPTSQTGAQLQFTQDSTADWVIGQPAGTNAFAFWTGRNPSNDGTERARIDSSGVLLVGATSNVYASSKLYVAGDQAGGGAGVATIMNTSASGADASPPLVVQKTMSTTSSSARFVQFYADGQSVPMGGIVGNGASNVQFATLSDAREKTNIQSISGSLEKINALRPVEFDWIANGEHCPAGFVAQDVEQVFPEFVVENISNAGEEDRKGLTGGMTGGIVAHLVAAIQEQQAIINDLKARLDAANL